MTLNGDSRSRFSMTHRETNSSETLTWNSYDGEDGCSDLSGRIKASPSIVPVYNGKVLDISSELMCHALSGISFKHYDGSCVQPQQDTASEESLLGEEYIFDYGEWVFDEEDEISDEKSKTMSSMMRLCYTPKRQEMDSDSENIPEGESELESKPLCVLDRIHDRNSFWNLHRPELCKLTWPQVYVGEATITEHLHRHLLHHGQICSGFHERRDILGLLNKELDSYDKLKELQPPRDIPPDEKPFDALGNRKSRKTKPCKPCAYGASGTVNWNDESDLDPYQSLHASKEEFCITIGKPIRRSPLRGIQIPEPEQLWLAGEDEIDYGEYREYTYPEIWEEGRFMSCEGEAEGNIGEEELSEPEAVPQQPVGWVEPDFCAMI